MADATTRNVDNGRRIKKNQRTSSSATAAAGNSESANDRRKNSSHRYGSRVEKKPRADTAKTNGRKWMMYPPPTVDGTTPVMPPTFRMVSFNVLADYLVVKDGILETEKAWKYEWTYRSSRLVKEILAWFPHIICLQEVDHFDDFFEPELKKFGFVGVYKRRTGETTHDGCAIFVKKSMFKIVSTHPIEYHVPGHKVLNKDNIALAVVLEWDGLEQHRFIVTNTHILFNPNRGEIKLAQLEMLLNSVKELRQDGNLQLPVLFCGDFNLAPQSALYHYLSSGSLDASGLSRYYLSGQRIDHNKWLQRAIYTNEKDSSRHYGYGTAQGRFDPQNAWRRDFSTFKKNTIFSHDFNLASAYAQSPDTKCTGEPKFTTFHSSSKSTVDYIWFTQDSMHCHGVVEMVPAPLLFAQKELPTAQLSSDHLSLVAEFSLRAMHS